MNDPLGLVFFGGVIALMITTMLAQLTALRKARAFQAAMAARLGFEFIPAKGWTDTPRVTGGMSGKRIEFFNFHTGAGKSRKLWSAVSAAAPAPGAMTFLLCRRNLGTKLRSFFGAKSIQAGDAAFDSRWFIQTNRPDFFRAALIPELRAALDAVSAGGMKGGIFKLEAGVVRYAEQGNFNGERCARYETLLPLLCDLAAVAEVEASFG